MWIFNKTICVRSVDKIPFLFLLFGIAPNLHYLCTSENMRASPFHGLVLLIVSVAFAAVACLKSYAWHMCHALKTFEYGNKKV